VPVAALGVIFTAIAEPLPFAPATSLTLIAQASAFAVVVSRYRTLPAGVGRQQIRWALFGFATSVIALGLSILCLLLGSRAESFGSYYWLGIANNLFLTISSLLLALSLTVSLLRWRLYDANRTISRSLVYGSEKLIELMGEEYLGEQLGALAGALGAAVAAVCVGPLHHRVTHWTEKRFPSGLVRLRDGLPVLAAELCEIKSPAALADIMLDRVEQGLRASYGAVVAEGVVLAARDVDIEAAETWFAGGLAIDAEVAGLQLQRDDPVFPVRLPLRSEGCGLVAWLLLGPRPDGSFYGRDEQDALRAIAAPLARAIATATAHEVRDRRHDRDIDGLRELLQDLVTRLRANSADTAAPS
jgi:hypothetical protein